MNTRTKFTGGLLVAVAAIAAAALFSNRPPGSDDTASTAVPVAERQTEVPERTLGARKPTSPPAARSNHGEMQAMDLAGFRRNSAEDVLAFIEKLLPAARAGNEYGQFSIYEALTYCDEGYRAYFDRGTKRRSLDEALNWASTRRAVNMDDVRLVYDRCSKLKASADSGLGYAAEWLARATEAGLPKAQAKTASAKLLGVELARASRADRPGSSAKELDAQHAEGKELLVRALNTPDPAVTWEIADSLKLLSGSASLASEQQWVWRFAACIQGFDCTQHADWLISACRLDPYCPPGESGTDYIRRNAGTLGPNVERAAEGLAARLSRGAIGDADFEQLLAVGS